MAVRIAGARRSLQTRIGDAAEADTDGPGGPGWPGAGHPARGGGEGLRLWGDEDEGEATLGAEGVAALLSPWGGGVVWGLELDGAAADSAAGRN